MNNPAVLPFFIQILNKNLTGPTNYHQCNNVTDTDIVTSPQRDPGLRVGVVEPDPTYNTSATTLREELNPFFYANLVM